jgi:hypothetical protein
MLPYYIETLILLLIAFALGLGVAWMVWGGDTA